MFDMYWKIVLRFGHHYFIKLVDTITQIRNYFNNALCGKKIFYDSYFNRILNSWNILPEIIRAFNNNDDLSLS